MLKSTQYRSWNAVPNILIIMLLGSLLLQLAWHQYATSTQINREYLSAAPEVENLRLMALGDSEVLAKILMFWLQSFDNQPGVSLPLQELNYNKVMDWLEKISVLDEHSQYPLFSAAYIYAVIKDEKKQRQVFNFIEKRFKQHPNRYWRWLAHAAIKARHSLHDNDLALHFAQLLRLHATGPNVPRWAQQMEIGILEAKGEYQSVKLLIGGLLTEGRITDPQELRFLNERLKQLRMSTSAALN